MYDEWCSGRWDGDGLIGCAVEVVWTLAGDISLYFRVVSFGMACLESSGPGDVRGFSCCSVVCHDLSVRKYSPHDLFPENIRFESELYASSSHKGYIYGGRPWYYEEIRRPKHRKKAETEHC